LWATRQEKAIRGCSIGFLDIQVRAILEKEVNASDVVPLKRTKQRHLAISVLVVHIRASFDERACEIDLECLACYGMCEGSQPGDVLDVHRKSTRYKVV
jgi:hypothetical protein